MSSNKDTKFVVVFTPVLEAPDVTSIEGAYANKEEAIALIRELATQRKVAPEHFEIEGWRGRQYQGVWSAAGVLVEDRFGNEVEGQ